MKLSTLLLISGLLAAGAASQEPEKTPVGKTVEADPAREPMGKAIGGKADPEKPEPAAKARDRKLLLATMLSSLKDKDENIRAKAAEDISRVKPPAVEAVSGLINALKDPSPTVRYRAAETLEKIGTPKARKAVLKFRRKLNRDGAW